MIFCLLLLMGLLLRCYYIDWNKELTGDEVGYNKMVLQLLHEGIYGYAPYASSEQPNAFTTPGYPLFLAGCYLVFGYANDQPPIVQIQALQLLIQLLCALLMYRISNRLFEHSGISLFVMGCFLLHPTFILSPLFLLTETLYGFFFLLFVYFLVIAMQKGRLREYFWIGILFGVCILIRPTIVPFILILIAGIAVKHRRGGIVQVLRPVCLVVAGFLLMLLPWWIRNVMSLHKIVWLAEQSGNPLLWGSFPFTRRPAVDPTEDPAEMGKMAYQRIINGFRSDFFTYLSWYTWGKMMYFIQNIFPRLGFITENLVIRMIIRTIHVAMALAGFAGLLKMLVHERRNGSYLLLALLAFCSVVLYLPFSPTPRYFYPTLPLCFLGMGYLILCIQRRRRKL
ncbi:glycosyltransferase family 39 protein [Paenibacillus paridis]|uniref:glycosyltransferase family 39 protein n=1 Tax=Paenibacillus paridis TaxID=2583376 RepID=UPI0011241C52|nr:glycosyltransferase family 39 protein [Paenibacillus paridis]